VSILFRSCSEFVVDIVRLIKHLDSLIWLKFVSLLAPFLPVHYWLKKETISLQRYWVCSYIKFLPDVGFYTSQASLSFISMQLNRRVFPVNYTVLYWYAIFEHDTGKWSCSFLGIENLPFELQRNFTLMRELDQRTQGKLQSWKLCIKKIKILQLMNEAEYLMKNYEDWGGRYLSRPYM